MTLRIERYRNTRHWAVYEGETLVVVTVYKRGAQEVRRRLAAQARAQPSLAAPPGRLAAATTRGSATRRRARKRPAGASARRHPRPLAPGIPPGETGGPTFPPTLRRAGPPAAPGSPPACR